MRKNIIVENENEVEEYCRINNLDSEKLFDSPMCFPEAATFVLHADPEKGRGGLRNETPCPITLKVFKTNSGLRFEQTENTQKYLAV